MARTKKPFMTFETKEEFDEWYNKIHDREYTNGHAKGFKDGSIWVLSYVTELFRDMFKPEAFAEAAHEIRNRQIEQWRNGQECETLKTKLDNLNRINKMS